MATKKGTQKPTKARKTIKRSRTAEAYSRGEVTAPEGPMGPKPIRATAASDKATVYQRQDGRTLRRVTVYFPLDLFRLLAAHCASNDRDISTHLALLVAKDFKRIGSQDPSVSRAIMDAPEEQAHASKTIKLADLPFPSAPSKP